MAAYDSFSLGRFEEGMDGCLEEGTSFFSFLRCLVRVVRGVPVAEELETPIRLLRGRLLRWLNPFFQIVHCCAVLLAAIRLWYASADHGVLISLSVPALLLVMAGILYFFPEDKLTIMPCAFLLRGVSFLLGLAWAVILAIVLPLCGAGGCVLVGGVGVALIATSILLLPVAGAGALMSSTIAGGGLWALVMAWKGTHETFYPAAGLALIVYLIFILLLETVVRALLTSHLLGQRMLEQRGSIVKLLLGNPDENAASWLWEVDAEGKLSYVSSGLAVALGKTIAGLKKQNFITLLSRLGPPRTRRSGFARLEQCLEQRIYFRDVVIPIQLKGKYSYWSVSGRPVFRHGKFAGYQGVGTDVSRMHHAQRTESFRARHDLLTGLPNRAAFFEDMERNLIEAEGSGESFALLNLDLDGFKQVNDRYGHKSGDDLLKQVSLLLSRALSDGHRLYRFGGDEFILIQRPATARSAGDTAEHLINTLKANPIPLMEGINAHVGLSVGIVLTKGGGEGVENLMTASDLALYESKKTGGQTYCFYDAELQSIARRNSALIKALPKALEEGSIQVAYQPIFHAQSGELCGFEALARWTHPSFGRVAPEQMVRLAEESGLIQKLGLHVMKQACSFAKNWPSSLFLSVNVSVRQLETPNFMEEFLAVLKQTAFKPARLQVEVTENVFMSQNAVNFALLHDLLSKGISVALDDFGKGFSSLGYLRFFRFSKIKLDALFVRDMLRDSRVASIVRAVIDLSMELGVAVTAEGVETREQYDYLTRLGCTEVQGYYFARPLTPSDVGTVLKQAPALPTVTELQKSLASDEE